MSQKPSIPQRLLYNMITVALLSTLVPGALWILTEYSRFNQSAAVLQDTHIESRKSLMKEQVDLVVSTIQYRRGRAGIELEHMLRARVVEAHAVATRLYSTYQHSLERTKLEELIRESIRGMRYDDGHGCYFAIGADGTLEVSTARPESEGADALATPEGAAVRALLALGKEKGEGPLTYTCPAEVSGGTPRQKLSYVMRFDPLDWTIGTGEFLDVSEQKIQQEILAWVDSIRFGDDYYLFAGQWDGLSLSGPARGQNMFEITDPNGVKIVQSLIQCARAGGGFVSYVMPKLEGQRPEPKISYARGIDGWNWYIGTGVYIDDINRTVELFRSEKLAALQKSIAGIFLLLVAIILGACVFVGRMARTTRRAFEGFAEFFEKLSRGASESSVEGYGFREFDELAASANHMLELRRAAEAALRESEERLQLLFAYAADAMYVSDLSGRLIQVNQQACETTGYTEAELLTMNVTDVDAAKSDPEALQAYFATLSPGRTARLSSRHRHKNGTTFPVEITVALLDTPGGPYVFGIARDVSERRRAEEERLQLEAQLQQAQKMEAVGKLTGGLAHDFNNLLQVINAGTDIALSDLEPEHPVRPLLVEVAQAGDRAANLVRQLLVFSRRQIMRPEVLEMNAVVEEVLRLIQRILGEHIRLEWMPGAVPCIVSADRGMVEQSLMNLCVNARDAMAEGGVLHVETGPAELDRAFCMENPWAEPGRYVRLTVRDSGCGMDAETVGRIYEPFFSTKSAGKGTGLGLSTVYGIVKQHRGLICATSSPGCGATFDLYWPQCEENALPIAPIPAPECRGGSETILMAEDDEMVRSLSQRILVGNGYTVLVAEDGEQALRLFDEHRDSIDLVILDVVMPKLGGREAYEQMRARRPGLRVLFASGYSETAIHKDFKLEGGLQLLQKPYTRDPFLRAVRAVLDSNPTQPGD